MMQKWKRQEEKPSLFRVDKIVAIKIDKVDKTSPLYPNVLIGKILHVENNYTKLQAMELFLHLFPPIA